MNAPSTNAPRPAAFLDRDGTIIEERHFLADPDGVTPLPRSAQAIRLLNQWGFWVFGVSNQSGVARGYFGERDVEAVNERVLAVFAAAEAYINRIYYCPHYPGAHANPDDGRCACRKPAPGMIRQAMHDYPVDLSRSFVVGDRVADVLLGKAVGVPGVLVLTGYGQIERSKFDPAITPDYTGGDLLDAVLWHGANLGFNPQATE